jgi:hypothetical protein
MRDWDPRAEVRGAHGGDRAHARHGACRSVPPPSAPA